jgi:predicted SprT family Zn-dependent metalloprotease
MLDLFGKEITLEEYLAPIDKSKDKTMPVDINIECEDCGNSLDYDVKEVTKKRVDLKIYPCLKCRNRLVNRAIDETNNMLPKKK